MPNNIAISIKNGRFSSMGNPGGGGGASPLPLGIGGSGAAKTFTKPSM